jgi:AcrR family transcriptional regulator
MLSEGDGAAPRARPVGKAVGAALVGRHASRVGKTSIAHLEANIVTRKPQDDADASDAQREHAGAGETQDERDLGPTRRRGPRGGRALVEERVLTAARGLFAEKEYREVTVREIAARAGVSHALVHRYLGSKVEILAAVLKSNEEWIRARAGGATTLRDAALSMLREIRRDRPDYFKLVARLAMGDLPAEMRRPPESPATAHLLAIAEHEAGGLAEDDALLRTRGLVCAIVALAIGWTVAEDFLVPTTRLGPHGERHAEAALERALLTLIDRYVTG